MNTKDLTVMYSTVFWCLFLVLFFFLALLHNHFYSLHTAVHKTKSSSLVIRCGRVLDQSQQECCFRRNSNALQVFPALAQAANVFFLSRRSARKKLYNFPFKSGYVVASHANVLRGSSRVPTLRLIA